MPVKQVDTPVSSVDIAPTILESVGLSRSREMQGVNLADLAEVARRSEVFGAVFTHDVMDLTDPLASLKNRWVIQGNWKLIAPHSTNIRDSEIQLYDIVADPGETKNHAVERPQRTRQLHALIQQWWRVD